MIIGGGFGGVLAASRLKEAGFSDFKIIEKGGNFEELGIGTDTQAHRAI